MIFKAKSLNMVQPDSQWLYIITDPLIRNSTNITDFIDLLSEGSNVAFIYNMTDSNNYYNVIMHVYRYFPLIIHISIILMLINFKLIRMNLIR
jgi:hypothetical protein